MQTVTVNDDDLDVYETFRALRGAKDKRKLRRTTNLMRDKRNRRDD